MTAVTSTSSLADRIKYGDYTQSREAQRELDYFISHARQTAAQLEAMDTELFLVKGVRNELQDKCDALAAENARLREALAELHRCVSEITNIEFDTDTENAMQDAEEALEVTK